MKRPNRPGGRSSNYGLSGYGAKSGYGDIGVQPRQGQYTQSSGEFGSGHAGGGPRRPGQGGPGPGPGPGRRGPGQGPGPGPGGPGRRRRHTAGGGFGAEYADPHEGGGGYGQRDDRDGGPYADRNPYKP